LPAKVRGTEKKQGELLPEKGCLFPIEPISGKNHYGICKILRMRELCIKFKK
jgi:hypothetical protein